MSSSVNGSAEAVFLAPLGLRAETSLSLVARDALSETLAEDVVFLVFRAALFVFACLTGLVVPFA
jgi:hypothetical protein